MTTVAMTYFAHLFFLLLCRFVRVGAEQEVNLKGEVRLKILATEITRYGTALCGTVQHGTNVYRIYHEKLRYGTREVRLQISAIEIARYGMIWYVTVRYLLLPYTMKNCVTAHDTFVSKSGF